MISSEDRTLIGCAVLPELMNQPTTEMGSRQTTRGKEKKKRRKEKKK
jgi:hypothetical protein